MAEKHQKKKKGSALKILLAVLLLLVLTVGAAGVFAYNEINGNGGKPGAEVTVSIPQDSGVAAIAKELKEAGVIRSAYLFRWYVGHKGAAGKLQYGDFTLQTGGYSYDGLIAELSTYAKADSVRLTFPEGTTAIAIARKMEEAGLCTAEEFLEEANTGDFSEYTFWQYVPDDAPDRFMKCEGYLFPDTYEFLTDDTVHHYVATFYAHFDKQFTDEMYRELEKQELDIPVVVYNRASDKFASVYVDNYGAGMQAARVFSEKGITSAGVVSSLNPNKSSAMRKLGYLDGCRKFGIKVAEEQKIDCFMSVGGGSEAAEQLLAQPELPEALFTTNDAIALGIMRKLQEKKVAVPEQISILSYGGNEWNEWITPSLTTLRLPIEEMSSACVQLLNTMLTTGEWIPISRIFQLELEYRESCTKTEK